MKLCVYKNNNKLFETELKENSGKYFYEWETVESGMYTFYVLDNDEKYSVNYDHTAPFALTFEARLEQNVEPKGITGFENNGDIWIDVDMKNKTFKLTKTKFTRLYPIFNTSFSNIEIAGTFNNWEKDKNPVIIKNGKAKVLLNLEQGYYEYKYVIDGEYEKGSNRKLIIGESGKLFKKGELGTGRFSFYPIDDTIDDKAICHTINKISQFEYEFCLRTQMHDVSRAYISMIIDGIETIKELERFTDTIKEFDFFKRKITFDKKIKNLNIQYILEDGGVRVYFDGEKLNDTNESRIIIDTKKDLDIFYIPDWAKEAIWYNIFPDRFYNSNPYNDPIFTELGPRSFKNNPQNENFIKDYRSNNESLVKFEKNRWTSDFSARTKWEQTLEQELSYDLKYMRMYGGDIEGIKQKIPYLKELGITAIWLNPVFFSYQSHKYGINDFRHISPDLGTIRTSGSKHNVFVSPINKTYIDVLGSEAKNNSELELLEINLVGPNRGKNGYLETEDPSTWVWTESDLIMVDLIKELHKNGIRIIFDGVFNHSSERHWAFTMALLEGPDSEYAKWYKFLDFSNLQPIPEDCSEQQAYEIMEHNRKVVSYIGWAGFRTLPEFNSYNAQYKEYIFNITRKWLLGPDNKVFDDFTKDDGIDGFRLDVPNCLENQYFFTEFRKVMKDTKKDSYITAEIWSNASHEVNKNKYDAVMNYEWLKAVIGYFINQSIDYGNCYKLKASDFFNELREKRSWYPYQALLAMQNLNGSHDTDRLYSRIVNDKLGRNLEENKQLERGYNGIRPDLASNYHPNTTIDWINSPVKPKDILKLISVFQMTYIGAPMIYYGDELGMWGATDPYCRKPMLWDQYRFDLEKNPSIVNRGEIYEQEPDLELFAWYKKIIKIRKNNPALIYGRFKEIYIDNIKDVIAYERYDSKESIIVVINNSFYDASVDFKTYHQDKKFMDLLTNNKIKTKIDGTMKVDIKAKKAAIFKYNKETEYDK